jgi:hypothetical protein
MLTFHGKASMIAVVFPYLGLGAKIKKIYDLTESCFERHKKRYISLFTFINQLKYRHKCSPSNNKIFILLPIFVAEHIVFPHSSAVEMLKP